MDNLPVLRDVQIDTLIAQAIDKQVPVEALEKLLAMRKELRLEFAQEQFNIAMAAFQAECPIIKKTKVVSVKGQVAYRYAPIESIISQVRPLLHKHGFSYAIETATNGNIATATCIAQHRSGHSQPSSMTAPLTAGTSLMSEPQIVAATITFLKRYAFCNAFGILTGDEDTDGAKVYAPTPPPLITQDQVDRIELLCDVIPLSLPALLKQYSVANIHLLTKEKGDHIINQAEKYMERKRKEQDEQRTPVVQSPALVTQQQIEEIQHLCKTYNISLDTTLVRLNVASLEQLTQHRGDFIIKKMKEYGATLQQGGDDDVDDDIPY